MQILEKIKAGDCLERFDAGYFIASTGVTVKTKKIKEFAYVFGGKDFQKEIISPKKKHGIGILG